MMANLGGDHASNHLEAEIGELVLALGDSAVLTEARLRERAGSAHWRDSFELVVAKAKEQGLLRELSGGLYELSRAPDG